MLVRDEDDVEVADLLPAFGEAAGVDEQPGAVGFDEDARVTEVGDLHAGWRPALVMGVCAQGRVEVACWAGQAGAALRRLATGRC